MNTPENNRFLANSPLPDTSGSVKGDQVKELGSGSRYPHSFDLFENLVKHEQHQHCANQIRPNAAQREAAGPQGRVWRQVISTPQKPSRVENSWSSKGNWTMQLMKEAILTNEPRMNGLCYHCMKATLKNKDE
ncbi:Semaphorin-4B [Manis pentadactyla]|nr:Semaphorin-4B [Manis pentadactyla]